MMNADMHEICRRQALHVPGTASRRTQIIKADSHVKAEGRGYIYIYFWVRSQKLRKATISLVMSVRRTSRFPLDGFSWSFVREYFQKIRR